MNYIKHLSQWFELLRLSPEAKHTHIAIYIVLFQQWNQNRFTPVFIINRADLMGMSKIGSKSVYSNCMRDMHSWGWIIYSPSYCKYGQSTVAIQDLCGMDLQAWEANKSAKREEKEVILPLLDEDMPIVNEGNMETGSETANETACETGSETANETGTETAGKQETGRNYKTDKQKIENLKYLNISKKNYNEPL